MSWVRVAWVFIPLPSQESTTSSPRSTPTKRAGEA